MNLSELNSELGINSLRISRRFPYSRQRVYSAFTRSEELKRWFSPASNIGVNVVDFDCVVGGRFVIAYSVPSSNTLVLRGVFQEIVAAKLLVFTWCWDEPDEHAGIESLVRVRFEELNPSSCQVAIEHSRLRAEKSPERHSLGWQGSLERLKDHLAKPLNKD